MTRFLRRMAGWLAKRPDGAAQPSKHEEELAFWKKKYEESSGELKNAHYQYFYTSHFGIDPSEYEGRTILDVGCGPRGSLEWASNAKERVGLDPLVNDYRKLGIDAHRMSYVCAPSEQIPFPNGHFDYVASFNSLDHVDDVDKTLAEIARVLRKDGTFLLITEINHPPTATEPHTLTETLVDQLSGVFSQHSVKLSAIRFDHDIYGSLHENAPYVAGPGLLSARLIRKEQAAS